MFLSKVWIEWHWLKDPYQLHRALWQLFPYRPEDPRDFLFRVEDRHFGRGGAVLLQSAQQPSSAAVAQIIACKAFQFTAMSGSQLRFKIRANPIKTIKDEKQRLTSKNKAKSCRVPLITEDQQLQWLSRKLMGAAFLETAMVIPEPPIYFQKNDISGKIQPVVFEGIMQVQDGEALKQLVGKGVGPGKAMGCGLLSLALAG